MKTVLPKLQPGVAAIAAEPRDSAGTPFGAPWKRYGGREPRWRRGDRRDALIAGETLRLLGSRPST
jgi:hypothetical protein